MLEKLKQEVLEANLLLPKYGLITFTWKRLRNRPRERLGGHQALRCAV